MRLTWLLRQRNKDIERNLSTTGIMNSLRVTIRPQFERMKDFIHSLPLVFEAGGEVMQDGRNLIKSFRAPDGTPLVVKRYHKPRGINKLVYSWGIRRPKGERAYLYPDILAEHGIDTPTPVAYIEERRWGLISYSYFVSVLHPYHHKCYEWGNTPSCGYRDIARDLARFTARLHDCGILHRDYSPGNILWEQVDGEYHFALVDINQLRFGPVGLRAGCRNFARLWGQTEFFCLLAREYALQRHFDEERVLYYVLKYRTKFWKRYRRRKPEKILFDLDI